MLPAREFPLPFSTRSAMLGVLSDWLRHLARRRRWTANLASGRRGEDLAHRFLRRSGYIIVARNYRLAAADGEADLIAWDGDTLVIVEVKARHSDEFGPPERAIGDDKRAHLRRVARAYARKTDTPWERVRCDVVTVILSGRPQLQLVRGAFRI
jgi:putative endonuclease